MHNNVSHRVQPSLVEHIKVDAAAAPATSVHADGPGIILANHSKKEEHFFFYPNYWNGNGTAGANFDKPSTSISLKAGQTHFVSLAASFKGRVQRGKLQPA